MLEVAQVLDPIRLIQEMFSDSTDFSHSKFHKKHSFHSGDILVYGYLFSFLFKPNI